MQENNTSASYLGRCLADMMIGCVCFCGTTPLQLLWLCAITVLCGAWFTQDDEGFDF